MNDSDPPTQAIDDDGFSERVLASFKEIFWDPEIERRGGVEVVGHITKALAEMKPGHPVRVRFNDEFTLIAKARVNSDVKRGEPVTLANIDALETVEPVGVDTNSGWVAWLELPDGRQVANFDFVRNRGHSLRLLALADGYLATAESALSAGRLGPTAENAMAAAELAVEAQTYMFDVDGTAGRGRRNAHSSRQHWTKVQVGLGNTTADAHTTLLRLHQLRRTARYGEDAILDKNEITGLLASVRDLFDDAARRVGQPLRTQDPEFLSSLDLPTPDSHPDQCRRRPLSFEQSRVRATVAGSSRYRGREGHSACSTNSNEDEASPSSCGPSSTTSDTASNESPPTSSNRLDSG